MSHTFHIPVLGLCFSVDTALKVAKFGISSVAALDITLTMVLSWFVYGLVQAIIAGLVFAKINP